MTYGTSKSRTYIVAMAVAIASPALGQMPGAPVLQNAWAAPGTVVAVNIAGGKGSLWGGAFGWTPGNGRFQLSGGAGFHNPTEGSSRAVYGARLAFPVMQMMAGNLGIGGFVGIGGGGAKTGETTVSKSIIPAGIAVGYRRAVGTAGRGFSGYLSPNYQYHNGAAGKKGYFRVGGGVDVGISARFGLTLGFESGAKADVGKVGPAGGLYGVGLSMKLGR